MQKTRVLHAPTFINKWYDPLHIIMWPYWFIDLDLTCSSPPSLCSSFTATRCIAPKPPTCPSRLQLVHQAKSCLDLLHLSHMIPCHVSYVKALVWFWWIDETLCANLCSKWSWDMLVHIPSRGANRWRSWWWCDHGDDLVLGLGKEEREKQNGLKAKVKIIGPFCFGDQDT